MRTDSEILAWVAPLFDPKVEEMLKHDRMDAIVGAMSCGLGGREALEAAMGAIKLELDSPPMIWRTGVQRIADERDTMPAGEDRDCREAVALLEGDGEIQSLVQAGALIAREIDRLQSEAIVIGVDQGSPDGDCTVIGEKQEDGSIKILSVTT